MSQRRKQQWYSNQQTCSASDPVQDTIGARESFCGSLAGYLSTGLELSDATTKACGVASMSVKQRSVKLSYPTADELPDCLPIEGMAFTVVASKPKITFEQVNKKKLEEVQRILSSSGVFQLKSQTKKLICRNYKEIRLKSPWKSVDWLPSRWSLTYRRKCAMLSRTQCNYRIVFGKHDS